MIIFLTLLALFAQDAAARMPPPTKRQAKQAIYEHLDRLGESINSPSELYDANEYFSPLAFDERLFSFWRNVITKSTSSTNAAKAMANIDYMVWDRNDPTGKKINKDQQAIGDFLVQSLDHPNPDVRRSAVCSLGHFPNPYESIGLKALRTSWPESVTWCWGHSYGDTEWLITALATIAESTGTTSVRLEATKRLYELWPSYINGTFAQSAAMRKNRQSVESSLLRLTADKDDVVAYNAVKHFIGYPDYHPAELRAKLLVEFLNRPLSPQDPEEKKDLFISAMIIGMDRKPVSNIPEVRSAIKDATLRGDLLGFYKRRLSKEYLSVQQSYDHIIARWESHLK